MTSYKQPFQGQHQSSKSLMRLAQVVGVDTHRATVDVVFADGMGRRNDIRVAFPYLGMNSWIRTMPAVGTMVWVSFSEYSDGQMIGYHWPKYEQIEQSENGYLFKPIIEDEMEMGGNHYGFIGITKEGRVYLQSGTAMTEYIRDDQEIRSYAARYTRQLPNNRWQEDDWFKCGEMFGEVRRITQEEEGTDGDENIVYMNRLMPDAMLKPLHEHTIQMRQYPCSEMNEGPELFITQDGQVVDGDAVREFDPYYQSAGSFLRKKEMWFNRDNSDEIIHTYNDMHCNVYWDIPGQKREFIGLPKYQGMITKSDDTGSEFRSQITALSGGRKTFIGWNLMTLPPSKSFMFKDVSKDGKWGQDNVPYEGSINYGPIGMCGLPGSVFYVPTIPAPTMPFAGADGSGIPFPGADMTGGPAAETMVKAFDPMGGLNCDLLKMGGLSYGPPDLNTGERAQKITFGDIAADSGGMFLLGDYGITYDSTNRYLDGNHFPAPPNQSALMAAWWHVSAFPYISMGPGNTTPDTEPNGDYQFSAGNAEYVWAKDLADGKSVFLNTEGSMVYLLGRDNKGRSACGTLLGGMEFAVGPNNSGQAYGMVCNGDYNLRVNGNYAELITGTYTSIVLANRLSLSGSSDVRFAGGILDCAGGIIHIPPCAL